MKINFTTLPSTQEQEADVMLLRLELTEDAFVWPLILCILTSQSCEQTPKVHGAISQLTSSELSPL